MAGEKAALTAQKCQRRVAPASRVLLAGSNTTKAGAPARDTPAVRELLMFQ